MNSIFAHVFRCLPAKYLDRAVIAGGAAACYEKADDIDIWILGLNNDKKVAAFTKDLRAMNIEGIEFVDTAVEAIEKKTDSGENLNNQIVANIPRGILLPDPGIFVTATFTKPVQIMASVFMTSTDLLMDFDLSTHCISYNASGEKNLLVATTGLGSPPKVVCPPKSPDRTLSRYRRLCLRYGLAPDPSELVALCCMPDPEPHNG